MAQSFASHAHRPVETLIAGVFGLLAIVLLVGAWLFGWATLPPGAVSLSLAVAMLVSMSRTYITRLQDRIILLEERLRVSALVTPAQLARWRELTPKQVAALRFAGDAELPALLERTLAEGLAPTAIKRAVKDWRADPHRT